MTPSCSRPVLQRQRILPSLFVVVLCSVIVNVRAQEPPRENLSGTGKIKAVGPGVLQVIGENGDQWLVAIDPRSNQVRLSGTAVPSILRPGMLVKFEAILDKRGASKNEIAAIEVVSPRPDFQLGIIPQSLGGDRFTFADTGDAPPKKARPTNDPVAYNIGGTIQSIRDRIMYVAAGTATIKFELAKEARVSVDLADYRMAREGDAVEFRGWRYVAQPTQIYASEISIRAEKPLGLIEDDKKKKKSAVADADDALNAIPDSPAKAKADKEK